MSKVLELVHKLIDQLPQPNVGQLQHDGILGGDDQIEEITVVEERVDTLLQLGTARNTCMDMTIVQLLVENQKHFIVVDNGANLLFLRPGSLVEVVITDLWECVLIHVLYIIEISLLNCLAEVHEEIFDIFRHTIGVVVTLVFQIQLWIAGMRVVIVEILK